MPSSPLEDDHLGELRGEKPFEPPDPLDLAELGGDPLFQRAVPGGELGRLSLNGVVQPLDAQHRAHPRRQRGMIDGLGQIIVAAGFQPLDDVPGVGLGGDQDDRDERQ